MQTVAFQPFEALQRNTSDVYSYGDTVSRCVVGECTCVGMLQYTLLDDDLFAADDVDAWGQGACFGGVVCHFHAVEVVDGLAEFV